MNLKSTAGLLPITISIIFIFSVILILNQTEISAQPSDPIGFEELDDGKVWHIWNPHDDYYFNATSGIQFSNHYNEFWTHNIFCGGYKDAQNEWHYDCNDALPFNWSYDTDNTTYVNITGWRNKTIGTKTVRVALRYHLKLNDRNLTIIPYIKNIGDSDISQDLGFAWRVNNIQIGNDTENDQIEINDTFYWLNESLSINFTNMTALRTNITINTTCWDECNQTYDNETYCTELCTIRENYTAYIPYYIMFDENRGKFLRLDWNKNLTYKVMLSSTEQYNAPTTLGINIGPLSVSQEKSTEFYWIDAPPPGYIFPNTDKQVGWGVSSGLTHWNLIDEYIATPKTSDYIYTSAASKTDEWGFTSCPSDVGTVTALTVRLHIKRDALGLTLSADVNYSTDGGSTYSSTQNTGSFPTTATTVDLTWDSLSLSKSECDALQVQVASKEVVGGIPVNHYIYTANVNITYDAVPDVTLSLPGSGSTDTDGNVTFACNVTDDSKIENVTLYHNISGWAANQTFSAPIESFENCDDISDWDVTGGWYSGNRQCKDTTVVENNMTSQPIDLSADNINYANLTFDYDFNCGLCSGVYFRVWVNSSSKAWTKIFERTTDSGGLQSKDINLSDYITLDEGVHIRGSCDAEALGGYCIWDHINLTSYMSDSSSYSETSYNVTFNEITNIADGSYKWNCLAYDNAPQSAWASSNWTFTVDATSPQYSNNQTNTTLAGEPTLFSLYWTDNYGLSGYIFSFDNGTGTFSNDSWVAMTGASNWSNVTKVVNSTVDSTIRWIVYANDTNDNWNTSDTYQYTTTSNPPTHSTPIITPSPAYTNNNITCINQSTSDVDGDTVTNIYNWLKNGTSITLLNMPFDTNVSDSTPKAVRDYSGYGNNGTLDPTDTPIWTSNGKIGGAYNFTGNGDLTTGNEFINVIDSEFLTVKDRFTIMFWFKAASWPGTSNHFLRKVKQVSISHSVSSGKITFLTYNDTASHSLLSANNSLPTNQWVHAVFVYNSTHKIIYIDGVLDNSTAYSGDINDSDKNLTIGSYFGVYGFNGIMDELKIYNYSLTPQQIQQLYLEGLNNFTNSTIVSQETLGGQNWTCQVTPNDATDDGQTLSNSSIIQPCSLAIGLSDTLGPPDGNINWTITSLPSTNISAEGNNGTGITLYNVSINATGCTADVYIKANDDLRSNGNSIGLGNETYCYNTTDNTVPGSACTQFDTTYAGNPIGSNLGDDSYIYLKFYLSIPGAQPAGSYNNSISIKGVKYLGTP